jgi:hypothetical protein
LLSVHCLGSSELLFRRDRSWYWIDCLLQGKACHLFFEVNGAGQTTVHYSTFPAGTTALRSEGAIALMPADTSGPVLIRTVSPAAEQQPKNSFRAEAVELICNGVRAGTGILYTL